jgi:hypothetical protein
MATRERMGDLDPVYEYVFQNKMEPYIAWAKEWWKTWQEKTYFETGTYPPGDGAPRGLFIRFSRTLAHSPVRGVQAFPYVSVPYLNLHHVPGGIRRFVDELCHSGFTLHGMVLIERRYLHGTERNGQFICIVPQELFTELDGRMVKGRYVWLSGDDILTIASGVIDGRIQRRFRRYCEPPGENSVDGEISVQ